MEDMSGYYSSYYQPPAPPAPPPAASQYWHPPSSLPPPQPQAPPQYHHNPPHAPPPPSYASPYVPPPHHQYYDDVRTLFIAGLPGDVKAREIYNLFRELPGYESYKLRRPTEHNQPYGFAVFRDQHSAAAAMQELNGLVFDLEKKSTLYISLAKSNSKPKRSRLDDGKYDKYDSSDKKFRASAGFYDPGAGSNVHMHGLGNSAYNTIGSSTQRYSFDRGPINGSEIKNTPVAFIPQNSPPCATLFVANLGPNCAEMELIEAFSRYAGFLKLKMQNKNGAPVAFVDFQDIACSTAALNGLQGTVLHTSSGLCMTIEYAKSRMGKPKKG